MSKYLVVKDIGSEEQRRFAVVCFGEAFEGKWKRKCLWVEDWYINEDAARAAAHRLEHPEF